VQLLLIFSTHWKLLSSKYEEAQELQIVAELHAKQFEISMLQAKQLVFDGFK
jgi:hypothetical protein